MPPRISPLKDAIQHVVSRTDKTCKLEVKFINAVKGRGVFASGSICKGDFVVEYRGDMINDAESQRRSVYHPSCTAFMFAFKWRGKTWCIDASRDDGSFGRLVNDDHRHPNYEKNLREWKPTPLFALNDIEEGQEITYDYGGDDCPWRTQTNTTTANDMAADGSCPSPHSVAEEDEAPGPSSTQRTNTTTANDMAADGSCPSLQSVAEEDEAPGPSSNQRIVTDVQAQDLIFAPKLRRTKSIIRHHCWLVTSSRLDRKYLDCCCFLTLSITAKKQRSDLWILGVVEVKYLVTKQEGL